MYVTSKWATRDNVNIHASLIIKCADRHRNKIQQQRAELHKGEGSYAVTHHRPHTPAISAVITWIEISGPRACVAPISGSTVLTV